VSDEKEEVEPKTAALVPIEEKTVEFYGDQITAALVETPQGTQEVYVPLKPISDYLGLTWAGQFERIKRDPVLSEFVVGIRVTRIPKGNISGGLQESTSIPLEYLPGWLFGINANRVKPELRDKIIRYQRDCYRALWKAFQEEARITAADSSIFDSIEPPSEPPLELIQLRELGRAIMQMAEQQIELERKVTSAHDRLNKAAQMVSQIRRELSEVKRIVLPGATISEAQASVIVTTVKALAEYLTIKEPGKNHYQGIFTELHYRFRVTNYHMVQQSDYAAALAWLDGLYRKTGGEGIHTQALLPLDPEPEA
jgi:hypothetical protein